MVAVTKDEFVRPESSGDDVSAIAVCQGGADDSRDTIHIGASPSRPSQSQPRGTTAVSHVAVRSIAAERSSL